MQNLIKYGKSLSVALAVAVASGELVIIGALPAIAAGTYAANELGEYKVRGVYELPALDTSTAVIGSRAYWDNTNKRITDVAVNNSLVGVFWRPKIATEVSAAVGLSGVPVV